MDRTFDRAVRFDERSKEYPIRTLVAAKPLRSYTWRHLQLDQGSEGACFSAGTWVRMADGSHEQIENIKLLDVVTTAEGRTGVVMQTMVRNADRIATVRLRGHLDLRCTPEHPVLTERGYVAAADLAPGDKVAVTRSGTVGHDIVEARTLIPFNLMRG